MQHAFRKGYVDRSSRPRGVFKKRWSENMQVIYRGTPLPKCDFNKVSKQLNCKITFSVKLRSPIERIHLFACDVLKECFIFSYSTQMLHGKLGMQLSEATTQRCSLLCNVIEITFWHGCSSVNLLHIFRIAFLKSTSGWLLLNFSK